MHYDENNKFWALIVLNVTATSKLNEKSLQNLRIFTHIYIYFQGIFLPLFTIRWLTNSSKTIVRYLIKFFYFWNSDFVCPELGRPLRNAATIIEFAGLVRAAKKRTPYGTFSTSQKFSSLLLQICRINFLNRL